MHLAPLQVRVSAIMSNAPFLIVLYARHFVKNPALVKEAMCFFSATASGESTAFVHFPLPLVDQYGSYDAVTPHRYVLQ